MGLEERGYPNFGYASSNTQNGSSIWTLLEAIDIVLKIGFPNESPVGDTLRPKGVLNGKSGC